MAVYKNPETKAQEPADTPEPKAPAAKQVQTKQLTEFQGKKIVARRSSRQGDDGYQLNTLDDQVTIIMEDGSDKVVKSSDLVVEV